TCAPGFANCEGSSPDCETTFAAGGACVPRYLGTTAFAPNVFVPAVTVIGTDGSFFLTGTFRGTVDFDPSAGQALRSTDVPAGTGSSITKLRADGSYAWTRTYLEPGSGIAGLAAADGGALLLVGGFFNTIDLDPGSGVDRRQTANVPDSEGLIVK